MKLTEKGVQIATKLEEIETILEGKNNANQAKANL